MRSLIGVGCTSVVIAALGLLGCSSKSSGTTSSPISSQPSTKTADTLTASQATQVCQEVATYAANNLKGTACIVEGIVAGGLAAALGGGDAKTTCQSAYNECMKQSAVADAGTNSCATAASDYANCAATIGELNQCEIDYINAFKSAYASMTCDSATADAGIPNKSVVAPKSCTSIEATCQAVQALVSNSGG